MSANRQRLEVRLEMRKSGGGEGRSGRRFQEEEDIVSGYSDGRWPWISAEECVV